MSFYNDTELFRSNNRIPKDSVVFVKEEFELDDFTEIVAEVTKEEDARRNSERSETISELKREVLELLKKEEEWEKEKESLLKEIEREKEEIIRENNKIEQEKKVIETMNKQLTVKQDEIEKNKLKIELEKDAYFLKNKHQALKIGLGIAEEIIAQKIELKDVDVEWLIMSMLKKMPSEFSKLNITVSPETYDNLKENKDVNWLFSGAEWSYDFRLKFGEFILKQEDEYKVFVFDEVFSEMHEKLDDLERYESNESRDS